MADMNSPSLLGLIGRISSAANDIRKRTSSVADVLCGGCPQKGESEPPSANDMHSELQRILTKMEHINDNVARTERAIGVCPDQGQGGVCEQQPCDTTAQTAPGSGLRRY